MLKVIRKKDQADVPAIMECVGCNSLLEIDEYDIFADVTNIIYYYFVCPVCKKENIYYHNPLGKVYEAQYLDRYR